MAKKNNALGSRMKEFYENRTRYYLPRKSNTLIRIDGKSFHTFTRGMKRPYCLEFMELMNQTAISLCANIQNARCAFVQSDEITILLTEKKDSEAWFDGNLQKMASISASEATAAFNANYLAYLYKNLANRDSFDPNKIKMARFDSRIWVIPDIEEVVNCFIWRQEDATKNSISMAAQSIFSHKELQGKNGSEMQEMMWQKGVNWNDYPVGFKRGRFVEKIVDVKDVEYTDKRTGEKKVKEGVSRSLWKVVDPPVIASNRDFIRRFLVE